MTKQKKAIVLSSGGCDSTVCLGIAVAKLGAENVSTVAVRYGQKHCREIECSQKIADYYRCAHYTFDLSEIFKSSNCPLLSKSSEQVPEGSYDEQIGRAANGKVATYVPFRNGLMLSVVASLAMSIYPDDNVDIYIGAHADDAAGNAYADCSESFTTKMSEAIYEGTYGQVNVITPLIRMNKAEVVEKGLKLKVPFELTTSCYNGKEKACGKCGTCIDRINAFKTNGEIDPIEYEFNPFETTEG